MNIIRRTRLLAEISQGDLARAIGMDQGRLSLIETGKIAVKPERRKQILNAIQRLATLKASEAEAVAKVRAEFSEEARRNHSLGKSTSCA